jgi:hypothetical protein
MAASDLTVTVQVFGDLPGGGFLGRGLAVGIAGLAPEDRCPDAIGGGGGAGIVGQGTIGWNHATGQVNPSDWEVDIAEGAGGWGGPMIPVAHRYWGFLKW